CRLDWMLKFVFILSMVLHIFLHVWFKVFFFFSVLIIFFFVFFFNLRKVFCGSELKEVEVSFFFSVI
ncbi:hypothetical protein DF186_14365, partial [Enterococcus hirae]